MPDVFDERRKRLHFRAWRRGFREIDLILGGFADQALSEMDEAGLTAFEALLNEADQDVYEWLIGRTPAPGAFAPLIAHIQDLSARLRPTP